MTPTAVPHTTTMMTTATSITAPQCNYQQQPTTRINHHNEDNDDNNDGDDDNKLLSPILVIWMGQTGNPYMAFLCESIMEVSLSFMVRSLCAWLIENFESQGRLMSAAVGYNIGLA
jgi:hypothetical protein